MLSPLKKSKSNEEDINQSLREIIYKKVTKKIHHSKSPDSKRDGTLKKCIEFFKKGADPEVLTKSEKSLREQIELKKSPKKQEKYQKHYKYYIKNFLPALKDEVIKSEELAISTAFNNEIEQSQRPQTIRGKIVGIILNIISRGSDKDHFSSTIQNQSDRRNSQTNSHSVETSEPNSGSGSDSGVGSPRTSEESSRSRVSSRRSSVSSVSSSVEGNDNPQKEEFENQMQPVQIAEEEPKMQENENSGGQANPDQVKNEVSLGVIQVADTGIRREKI